MQTRLRPTADFFRTGSFLLALIVMVGSTGGMLAGCEEKEPTVTEYLTMSGLRDREKIRIAVLVDVPLLGMREKNGSLTGFDVEIGRYIARSLGFDTKNDRGIEWVPTTLEDRERKIQEDTADLVIATYSITDERKKRLSFAGPYLITSQELLIDPTLSKRIRSLRDLEVESQHIKVCLPGATTSQTNLEGYKINTTTNVNAQTCLKGMRQGRYQVFTTDEVVLAGFNYTVRNQFKFVNVPFETTEQYGIAVSKDNRYLKALVEHYLEKSFDTRGQSGNPWQEAWDKTLKKADWKSENGKHQPRPEVSVRLRDPDDVNEPR